MSVWVRCKSKSKSISMCECMSEFWFDFLPKQYVDQSLGDNCPPGTYHHWTIHSTGAMEQSWPNTMHPSIYLMVKKWSLLLEPESLMLIMIMAIMRMKMKMAIMMMLYIFIQSRPLSVVKSWPTDDGQGHVLWPSHVLTNRKR